MLTELEIKEEPLDENENQQEMFNKQQPSLLKQQLQMELIKGELDYVTIDNFHIVEEHDQFITVSAADMKTQDELQFIEKLENTQKSASKFAGTCSKCLKTFVKQSVFVDHIKRNNCIAKQKCPVCPLTFIDSASLLKHLNMHRENWFFCSQNCGANFKTLPLCEDHETRVHKTKNQPKIRYKHFCSFCREGFKTELQLHVHWLQQNHGCGKLMQDVALHSSIASNAISSTNNTNSSANNNSEKNKSPSPTNFSAAFKSSLSVTKLRLKSNLPPLPASKRSIREDGSVEGNMKRSKFVDNLKSKMATADQMLFHFSSDLEIKEEPLDEDDVLNTTPLAPEVIIKTEEEEEEEEESPEFEEFEEFEGNKPTQFNHKEMKSLLINNNRELNPEFQGKIIPMAVQSMTKIPPLQRISNNNNNDNNNNTNNRNVNNNINIIGNKNGGNSSLKNITNLKFVRIAPASQTATTRLTPNIQITPMQQPQVDFKIIPAPKMSLQIIKILPNTQLLTFRSDQQQILNNSEATVKLHSSTFSLGQIQPPQQTSIQITKIGPAPPALVPSGGNAKTITPCGEQQTLNSTLLYSDEFTKLQNEAMQQADEHRIQYISKKNLIAIESLPEKKHLIDSMKQQIAKVAIGDNSLEQNKPSRPPPLSKLSTAVAAPPIKPIAIKPPTLYLPIMSAVDVELVDARYKYPEYAYKWICPYCLKDYDIKRCLKSHLTKAHNLTARDMDKINVQAKAFRNEEVIIEFTAQQLRQEFEVILPDTPPSKIEPTATVSPSNPPGMTTSPKPIKMSALKTVKPRYVCDKCGRKCSSKTMLNDHVTANCSREPQYECPECPKKFYSSSTLQCHITIHSGELPHKCSYCEKRFRTRGQVTVHHRTHTGERPFVCQVCSQRFTHRETLIAHLSRHIGMKRYKCYCCDKHFSCISALKTHREIRPDTCGKVKFNPRAIGPRVRVVRGNVIFEPQPEINPYLRSEDPKSVLAELQNQPESVI